MAFRKVGSKVKLNDKIYYIHGYFITYWLADKKGKVLFGHNGNSLRSTKAKE